MRFLKLLKKNKTVEPETYEDYIGSLIEKKIRQRYSLSAELAILRQRDSKPKEFAIYNEYAELCKVAVKQEVDE